MSDPNNYVSIKIPYNLYKDFLDLLDSAQCQYTEEELRYMAPTQVELITYISHVVGERATPRFKSIKQWEKACKHAGKELLRR